MNYPPIHPSEQSAPLVTSEERNMGMLAHVLMIFTGFIGPLIIFLVRRDSRFVRYHSLMALFWQLIVLALSMIWMVVFFASIFGTILQQSQHPGSTAAPPAGFFVFLPLIWLGSMLFWVINLILGIVYGIKAHDGKWDGYPVIKGWAAKVAGI